MVLYSGPVLADGEVSIGPAEVESIRRAAKGEDVAGSFNRWFDRDLTDSTILYFSIHCASEIIGQIFLHDIDREKNESLVGYHIFETRWRRRGIGTKALRLLQRYVSEQTDFVRLIAITWDSNIASRGVASACGFREIGPSREDPDHGVVMEWKVERA